MGTSDNVLKFKYLKKLRTSINEPQSFGPRISVELGKSINKQVLTTL